LNFKFYDLFPRVWQRIFWGKNEETQCEDKIGTERELFIFDSLELWPRFLRPFLPRLKHSMHFKVSINADDCVKKD
jgi:hypothetical protein